MKNLWIMRGGGGGVFPHISSFVSGFHIQDMDAEKSKSLPCT